jgi:hypothetical protein
MGLSGEKGPLGENKREKEKEKKGKEGGGAMGPRAHEGGATSTPLGRRPPPWHVG